MFLPKVSWLLQMCHLCILTFLSKTAIDLFCGSKGCEFTALITELSRFVLNNNYFEADGTLHHWQWGIAMGTPMAVSAAVIYLAIG